MSEIATKDSVFGEGSSYSFRLAITSGQVEQISKFIEERYSTIDLGGLLHYALSHNETKVSARLLLDKYKCPIDSKNESNETPLHVACRKGNLNTVRMLIKYGADLKAYSINNNTPLHTASLHGHTDIVVYFIDELKCCPDIKGSEGATILHQACQAGNIELVETLLTRYNLNPLSVDDIGDTPLHYAATFGFIDIVKLLIITYKCPADYKNKNEVTPLHYACSQDHLNVVRLLVSEFNADLLACDDKNNMPLHKAAQRGHINLVKCLIDEFHCSLNIKGNKGRNILHQACHKGHTELAETLLNCYNLDPFSADENGDTPLHFAALSGTAEIVDLLISKYKCSVDCKDNNSNTPLHFACSKGHLNLVRMLVSNHKADICTHNKSNDSPLSKAAQGGHINVVQCLVEEFYCSPNIKGYQGRSLLHQVCHRGHTELVETLLTHYGLDPLSVDDNGDTPLHCATLSGMVEIMKLLIIKYKCPVDCKNKNNKTPLHYAVSKGHKSAIRMLVMEHNADSRDLPPSTIMRYFIDDFPNISESENKTLRYQVCGIGYVEKTGIQLTEYNLDPLFVDDVGDTPLHYAASCGMVNIVKVLIVKYKCPVDCKNESKETPLHSACSHGHLNVVRLLVSEYNADLLTCDDKNNLPLHKAAKGGHTKLVKCLIDEFDCSSNIKGNKGRNILHQACHKGHTELAETLLNCYNLDPFSADENGDTPLHFAALSAAFEIVDLILSKYKCSVDCKDNNNNTPLHFAALGGTVQIVDLLIVKYKFSVDCKNKNNQTPLHYACSKGYLNVVRTLVTEHKADLRARNDSNDEPLNVAALGGHTNLIKYLIDEFHCDPYAKGSDNGSILHQACKRGHVELAETLLTKYCLDPFSVNVNGSTPLHFAARSGMIETVKLLIIEYKCPVDCKNNNSKTPLHYACSKGHLNIIRMLVSEYNANINVRDVQHNTPLHIAALYGHINSVKHIIEEFGIVSSTTGHEGSNILHLACSKGYVELAEILISCYNLDPFSINDNGNTPLHLAALNGREETVNLLITKYKCPIDSKNEKNESPLDLALTNGYQNIINLMRREDEGIKDVEDRSIDKEISYLPMILREGYICAAQNSFCIVQMPNDRASHVTVNSIDDTTLHPKLLAKEFLLTPVVSISSDTKVFSPDKQAVIELLKTTELSGNENEPIPMFSITHQSQPPQWQDLNPDDFEVHHDRIVFNTTHFSLFTVIARLPIPTHSIKVTPHENDKEPIELTVTEVANLQIVIPPCSIKCESETELKVTANFDHPSLCEESIDATACITLEPHGLQFKERIPIKIPIPDYAQITEKHSDAKLQFLYSNDPLDSASVTWSIIPENEYEIVNEGDQYVGIVYSTHFSNRKAKWLNIPKLKAAIQGPIHELRKCIAKKLLKTFTGRCQVFMSSETVVGNFLNFSIAAILHPLQECHAVPKNYAYLLYDSEKTPMTVMGSSLKLIVELADYCCNANTKKFFEDIELSGDFSARADFNINLDSDTTLVDGAVLGKLSIEYGETRAYKMNLIKPKKDETKKSSQEDLEVLSTNTRNGKQRAAVAKEPEITIHLPSLDSTTILSPKDINIVYRQLWPARLKWHGIGVAVGIDVTTLEVIKLDNIRTDDCFREMLISWLRNIDPVPCWKNLTSALESIELKVLLAATTHSCELLSSCSSSIKINKKNPVPLPRKKIPGPVPLPRKKPPVPHPRNESRLANKTILVALQELNATLDQWECNHVTDKAQKIANFIEQMAAYIRECDIKDNMEKYQEDIAILGSNIVRESEELIIIGDRVAEACTKATLKKALQQENLPKIEPIIKQFKHLMKSMKSSYEEQGEIIVIENAKTLLSVVKKVVEDIQVATIAIKDHSVKERLGFKWVTRDVCAVKKFGPTFIHQE